MNKQKIKILHNITNKPSDAVLKRNVDLLIKEPTLPKYIDFPTVFVFLNIHRWFNITNIIPPSPGDGSLEPKRYSIDLFLILLGIPYYQLSVCLSVCLSLSLYIYICVCVYICTHIYTHICTCVYIYIYVCVFTISYIYIYIYIYIHTRTYMRIYIYICIYDFIYIYIYIYVYIHAYIYMCIYRPTRIYI